MQIVHYSKLKKTDVGTPINPRPPITDLPTFELFFSTLTLKLKSDAILSWTDEDQPQIWSSHYSSTNNYLHYLLEVRMRATSAWGQE